MNHSSRLSDAGALGAAASLSAIVFTLSAWLLVAAAPMKDLMAWIADDAFYYYQVARNIISGSGPTFDGTISTNGWHPLYMGLTIIVQIIAGAGSELAVRAQFVLNAAMFAAAGILLVTFLYRLNVIAGGVVALLLWFSDSRLVFASLNGLEMALVLLSYILLLHFSVHVFQPVRLGHWAVLSVILSFVVLARLDLSLAVLPVAAWFAVRAVADPQADRPTRYKRLGFLIVPMMTLGALYVLLNIYSFGLPWPISGVVKRMWAVSWFAGIQDSYLHYGLYQLKLRILEVVWPIIYLSGVGLVPRLVVYSFLALGIALTLAKTSFLRNPPGVGIARSRAWRTLFGTNGRISLHWSVDKLLRWVWRRAGERTVLSIAIVMGVVLQLLYYSFIQLDTREWYWAPEYVLIYLAWGLCIGALLRPAERLLHTENLSWLAGIARYAISALAMATLVLVPYATISGMNASARSSYNAWDQFYYEAATWMRKSLPQGALAGAWNAGIIGYFSGLRVTNLDGLANGADFLPYVNDSHNLLADGDHHIAHYIIRRRLQFVVLDRTVGQDDPGALGRSICFEARSCRVVYFEYRTNSGTGLRRWLSIIELNG